jgi:MFS family permease
MLYQRLDVLRRRVLVPPRTMVERNTYFLYAEVIFASILGAAGSFNAAYILRMGGSNALIGLLSSIPSLVAMFSYIPAARILERQTHLMPWIVRSLLASRAGYVLILTLPLFLHRYVPELTVAILVAMTLPAVLYSTGWSPMLSEVIPPRSRANVLAWRSILASAAVAPLIYGAGLWLEHGPLAQRFPANYQWLYAIGFLGGACSVYLVSRMRMEPKAPPASAQGARAREGWLATLRSALTDNPGFKRIVVNTLLLNLGAWLVGPLYIIFFVRKLGATDGWIGLNGTLANIGVIVGYWIWRRIIHRTGEAKALLIALPLSGIYPFMVALWPNLSFILFAGFLINVTAPGVNLSHGVIYLGLLPEGKKHASTAIYSTVMNIGAFISPLIGVALADRIGIPTMLLIGGGMQLAGAALFYVFPVLGTGGHLNPVHPC